MGIEIRVSYGRYFCYICSRSRAVYWISRSRRYRIGSVQYIHAAREYYDKGSKAFRTQLLDVSPQNVYSVYMFSFMAIAINMALLQCVHDMESILGRISMLSELFLSRPLIAERYTDWLSSGSISTTICHAGLQLSSPSSQPINYVTDAAL